MGKRSRVFNTFDAHRLLHWAELAGRQRERERFYTGHGIHAVPSVIVNDQYLIQGGQPVAVFEQVLRKVAAEPQS